MKNELQGTLEGSEAEIHLESPKVTLKKVANWKAPRDDGLS